MIKINVFNQSNYPINSIIIKKRLKDFFQKKGIVSDMEVSVSIVSAKKMLELSKKYMNETGILHNVLSFPSSEVKGEFISPPQFNGLGEIVVCFPKVREEAEQEGILIQEKVLALIIHGAYHLVGKHHKI